MYLSIYVTMYLYVPYNCEGAGADVINKLYKALWLAVPSALTILTNKSALFQRSLAMLL